MSKKNFIQTVFIMCLMALPLSIAADDYPRGDCNQDGNVNISDVTTLINYLLTKQWPGSSSQNYQTFYVNGASFKMINVKGGTFTMGASDSDSQAFDNEKPTHQVYLSDFSIGETEVTQALWEAVMGTNPSPYTDNLDCPVEEVSWVDAQVFIGKLNKLTGKHFRLPTEAEWEYAARGGRQSQGYLYSGSNDLNEVAWNWDNCSLNGIRRSHPVGTKAPNELGLYDMSGNVWEFCQDLYDVNYYSVSPLSNPTGPSSTGSSYNFCSRGGSWYNYGQRCRITFRDYDGPTGKTHAGFRLAM